MFSKIFDDLWENYRGRLLGALIGLIIGTLFLCLGFLRAVFLLICICAGTFIGYKIDNKEDLLDLLDRLLPPGYHR